MRPQETLDLKDDPKTPGYMDHQDKGLIYEPHESDPCPDDDQKHREIVGTVEDLGIGEKIAGISWVYALDVEVLDISLETVLNSRGRGRGILHKGRDLVEKAYQKATEIDRLVITNKETHKEAEHQNKNSF